jgi:oligoendopeptidase F
LASTSLELLAAAQYGKFYSPLEARRAERQLWEEVVQSLPAYAWVDAFQHWVYSHPGHTREERRQAWRQLGMRFNIGVDWSGSLETEAHDACWHQVRHIFDAPLYYIEYAVGRLGSLQLWSKTRHDTEAALEGYFHSLELGGSKPLPELFAAAGLEFDFSERNLAPLLAEVEKEMERLDETRKGFTPSELPSFQIDPAGDLQGLPAAA